MLLMLLCIYSAQAEIHLFPSSLENWIVEEMVRLVNVSLRRQLLKFISFLLAA